MSDADLVRQTLAGRVAAFEELARRHSGCVLAFCRSKVRSRQTAEDMAQEALLRAYRGLASLSEPEKFGAWLRGIAIRACLDWLKSRQNLQVPFTVLGPDCRPEQLAADRQEVPGLEQQETLERLMAEVESLPVDYREVLLLYYYQDATYRDLAEQLGVSPATINARLTKARAMLRRRLSGVCEFDDVRRNHALPAGRTSAQRPD